VFTRFTGKMRDLRWMARFAAHISPHVLLPRVEETREESSDLHHYPAKKQLRLDFRRQCSRELTRYIVPLTGQLVRFPLLISRAEHLS